MLILTLHEWIRPGEKFPIDWSASNVTSERTIGMATNLSLPMAIDRLTEYEFAFNAHSILAIEYSLLGIATIDQLDPGRVHAAGLTLIEDLARSVEDFD